MTEVSSQAHCSCSSDRVTQVDRIFDLCRAKKFVEAMDICNREIAARPDDVTGYQLMASVLELMKKLAEALPYRDKVVKLAPESAMSYFARADLHYAMGNYAAAISDFTRSAELDHEQAIGPANFLYRADCHRRLGNHEQAVADCALVPGDFDFPGFLGEWRGSKHHLLAEIERDHRVR